MNKRQQKLVAGLVVGGVLLIVLVVLLVYFLALKPKSKRHAAGNPGPSPSDSLPKKAVVISRYREDITKLIGLIADQAKKDGGKIDVFIYNKGPDNLNLQPHASLVFHVHKLPNVGRDGHTVLHHIVTNYDRLHDTTVFLAGSASTLPYKTEAAREALATTGQTYYSFPQSNSWHKMASFQLDAWSSSDANNRVTDIALKPSPQRPFGAWFKHMFGYKPYADLAFPHSWWLMASLPKTAIRDRPVDTYQKALSFLNDHSNPEAGHYVERVLLHLTSPMPRVVWLVWFQGWDKAPKVVRRVRESWEKLNPGWEVRALDDKTLRKYINPPFKTGMSPAAKSDMVRLHVLSQHGGVWADATMLCVQPLTQWVVPAMSSKAGMWMYHGGYDNNMPASWFMLSQPGSYIMQKWTEAANAYWASKDSTDNYFWMDALFKTLRDTDTTFRKLWDSVPKLQCEDPGSAHALAGKVYSQNPDVLEQIRNHVPYALKLDCHGELHDNSNGSNIIEWVLTSAPPPHKIHIFLNK
jgi:hypothetical protein